MFGIIITIVLFVLLFVLLGFKKNEDYDGFKFKVRKRSFLALLVLPLALLGGIKTVPTGHTGVVTTFGHVEDYTLEAGVHYINPLSKVIAIDNRTQKAHATLSAFSSDIQEVTVSYTINYCLVKENAQNLYRTIGLNYLDTVISPKLIEDVKKVTAQYTAEQLISSRAEVASQIEAYLVEDLAKYNIQVVATSIENLDFTDAFTEAVEAKQVAEQNKIKERTIAETKVIQAEADAKVKIIEAQAIADANQLLTESLTEEILRKNSIEKWDGVLPKIVSDGSEILDLAGIID